MLLQFEILSNLQKAQQSFQVDSLPQLRLSPPAIYHEKVRKKGASSVMGETSDTSIKSEKPNKRWQLRELRSKGSPNRFPLKSSIFGEFLDHLFNLLLCRLHHFYSVVCLQVLRNIRRANMISIVVRNQ